MGLLARTVNASMVASVRLAAENEELVAALREKSTQLEATFESVNQGVAVFDRDGRLATWNPRHRELHGYPERLYRRGVAIGEFLRHDRQQSGAADADGHAAGGAGPLRAAWRGRPRARGRAHPNAGRRLRQHLDRHHRAQARGGPDPASRPA